MGRYPNKREVPAASPSGSPPTKMPLAAIAPEEARAIDHMSEWIDDITINAVAGLATRLRAIAALSAWKSTAVGGEYGFDIHRG